MNYCGNVGACGRSGSGHSANDHGMDGGLMLTGIFSRKIQASARIGAMGLAIVIGLLLGLPALAQAQVTLASAAAPTAGQAGVTVESVTGSGFPAGTIVPASVTITLTPSGGGASTSTTATSINSLPGTMR